MAAVSDHMQVALDSIEQALALSGSAEVFAGVDLPELHRRADLIREMQHDLDELARRTEFDLTRAIRRANS